MKKIKIGLISLGCPKNQVDAEMLLASLSNADFELCDDAYESDVVIVNTCGFIESAKQEAIDTVLEMVELKNDGEIKAIVVTGCLAERYKEEIQNEIPEVDAVVGIGANVEIAEICQKVYDGERLSSFPPKKQLPLTGERILTTPPYWAYLKIAEGCSNCCTYCAIPMIRGGFRSRPMQEIVEEAIALVDSGAKELILVAQDTTRYGEDLYGSSQLPELLKQLCKIPKLEWIRMLYCYPERITDELLDVMASEEKVLPYLDLPLQHCDENILKAMNRSGSRESLTELISKIRSKVPNVILRTTLITGFPGETDEAFTELNEFIKEIEFDRLGCFTYSAEEGTKAALLPDQIDEDVKIHRSELIMQDQYSIIEKKNNQHIGKTFRVLVEGYDAYTDSYYGRTYMDAPEIDGMVKFTCGYDLEEGDFVDVEIFDINDYDLIGEAI